MLDHPLAFLVPQWVTHHPKAPVGLVEASSPLRLSGRNLPQGRTSTTATAAISRKKKSATLVELLSLPILGAPLALQGPDKPKSTPKPRYRLNETAPEERTWRKTWVRFAVIDVSFFGYLSSLAVYVVMMDQVRCSIYSESLWLS
jgi:hypothetical protein